MQSLSILAVLALAFSCSLAFDATLNQHWNLWKQTHNKQYSANEENLRYELRIVLEDQKISLFSRAKWEDNLKIVNDHNMEADLGVHTYWLGMNAYADMVKKFNFFNRSNNYTNNQ